MRVKKRFFAIFAALAAVALMASIGAGSASATVLCSESATTECASFEKGTDFAASLTGSTSFSTTGGMVLNTCTSGVIEGTSANSGGSSETVSVSIEGLTWESCTGKTNTISNGELEIHHISGSDNGTVTGKNTSVEVNSSFGSCTYGTGTGTDLGTLEGGSSAVLAINATLPKTAGGFLCPADVKWTASYSVTFPHLLYVGGGAAAGIPKITVLNSGGIEVFNSPRCWYFVLKNEDCKITTTNNSAFTVTVTQREVGGTEAAKRYSIINANCNVGVDIPSGKSCTDQVTMIVNPAAGWWNGYRIQVEEKGKPANKNSGFVSLRTK